MRKGSSGAAFCVHEPELSQVCSHAAILGARLRQQAGAIRALITVRLGAASASTAHNISATISHRRCLSILKLMFPVQAQKPGVLIHAIQGVWLATLLAHLAHMPCLAFMLCMASLAHMLLHHFVKAACSHVQRHDPATPKKLHGGRQEVA